MTVYQPHEDVDCPVTNRQPGQQFLHYNYDLCKAIDMLKLGIVLDDMVKQGWLNEQQSRMFHDQASILLATMRGENARSHNRILADQGGVAIPCEHDWQYQGTDQRGSHKGEDAYKCLKCHEREYRP